MASTSSAFLPTSASARAGKECVQGADGQPLVYPVPLFVRNTFIDFEARPLSLDGFFENRQVASCPTSMVSNPEEGLSLPQPSVLLRTKTAPAARSSLRAPNEDGGSECSTADTGDETQLPLTPNSVSPVAMKNEPKAKVLLLSEAVSPAPTPCPQDLPSIGSVTHGTGECKPCAFLHSKGCVTGKDCQFCHLCEPGEKKRRQKEKRAFFNGMRQLRQFVGTGISRKN